MSTKQPANHGEFLKDDKTLLLLLNNLLVDNLNLALYNEKKT